MPNVRANDIDIYYEEYGSGQPLLLIMGWGGNAATWKPQIPGLSDAFRVIAFDNRGTCRSSAPKEPYSIPQMAADTAGLLDALEIPQAHVFGISMGGMIAQELALAHPKRVGALVLGCTTAGGSHMAGAEQLQTEIADFQQADHRKAMDLEWFAGFLKRLWTEEALVQSDAYLQDFVLSMIRFPPPLHGLRNQAAAIAAHDTYERLPQIRCPTLVITGSEDTLIDPRNSDTIADRIPNAERYIFPGLKHAFHLERPEIVDPIVIDFIKRTGLSIPVDAHKRRGDRKARRRRQREII